MILRLLRNHSGVDFSLYKSTTVQRRITRRMVLNKQETAESYAAFLKGNGKELDALYSDVLISVTSFFRNPEAFDLLKKKIFPKLLQHRTGEPLRVWVLGCSTGQEAYSIAMAFMEVADDSTRTRRLQVFATDLDDALLDKARQGLYPKTLAQDIPPGRLRRFFVEEEGGYRVVKSLREMMVFARQNLMSDPPFSRMDLISCRNLLIYLEPSLQKKAIPTFHYALKPGGFLFLGASESIGSFTGLFEQVHKKHRIYAKKLETSKEELESANEDLTTVNEEMANRNTELNRLNGDLSNLQASMRLPVLLLGSDLVIRRFNTPAARIFNLLATDIGRPFTGARHKLVVAATAPSAIPYPVESVVSEVIETVQEREEEVRDTEGRWHSFRAHPYMTVDNRIDGAVVVLVDITEVKRSEQEIKAARDYAEMTLRTAPVPLLVLRADLRVQSANDAFYRKFKSITNETEGCLIYELGDGQWNIPKLREFLEEIIPRNSFFNDFEVTHEFPKIGRRTMLLSGRRLEGHEGVPARIFLAIDDITPLVEAHADVRVSERRFRRLFEAARDGILLIDPVTRKITDSNPFMSDLAGIPRQQLLGKELWEIGLIASEKASHELFRHLQKKAFTRYEQSAFPEKTGELCQVEVLANLYEEDRRTVIQCNVRDITERKRAENEIRKSRQALEQANNALEERVQDRTRILTETNACLEDLSKRLIKAQEDERERIARELHDEIGQGLTGLKLFVQRVRQNVTPLEIEAIQDMISEIMQEARQLSCDLHPPVLERMGLKAALDGHIKSFWERTGIEVRFHYAEFPRNILTAEVEIAIFRLIQEGLTNVAKHAGVNQATVQFFERDGSLHLEIHDSGRGFETSAVNTKISFGLFGMRERVGLLGGTFRAESTPAKGTDLFITLPVRPS